MKKLVGVNVDSAGPGSSLVEVFMEDEDGNIEKGYMSVTEYRKMIDGLADAVQNEIERRQSQELSDEYIGREEIGD